MPPRKTITDLRTENAPVAEAVPEAVIKSSLAETGIPAQAAYNAEGDLVALRAQMRALNEQVSVLADSAKRGAARIARQGEATVNLYPVSSLLAVAVVAAAVGLTVAGGRSQAPRSRYQRSRDDVADFVKALRARLNI